MWNGIKNAFLETSSIEDGILYQAVYHPEELPIPENLPITDPELASKINNMMSEGDIYAWWCLEVIATYQGFHESVYSGGMVGNSSFDIERKFNELKPDAKRLLINKLEKAHLAYLEIIKVK